MTVETKEALDAGNVQGPAENSDSSVAIRRVPVLETRDPSTVARLITRRLAPSYEGLPTLLHWDGRWWAWDSIAAYWAPYETEVMHDLIWKFLAESKYVSKDEDGKQKVEPWGPNLSRVQNVERAMRARLRRQVTHLQPGRFIDFPYRGSPYYGIGQHVVAFENGLLGLDSAEPLLPPTPLFFNTSVLPFFYDERAGEPKEWLAFLADVFEHEPEAIEALQQWFGYIVSGRTDLHKIFFIVGPTRSGKGTIAAVLSALMGRDNVAPSGISALGTEFGQASLIGKPLILMPDVRFDGVKSGAKEVERLLEISGEDDIRIPRKYLGDWNGVLPGRIVMMSNTTPVLRDVGGALPGRFEILTMRKSYLGREDTTLRARLLAELPAIFNWALEGLDDLEAQGRFTRVASAEDTRDQIRTMGSASAVFIDELLVDGEPDTHQMSSDALTAAYSWWAGRNGEQAKSAIVLGRDIGARFPSAKSGQKVRTGDGSRKNGWHGVALRCVSCFEEDSDTLAARAFNGKPVCEAHYSLEARDFTQTGRLS